MDIIINCDGGRIGELWWFNSSTTPIRKFIPVFIGILDTGMVARQRVVQWGTFGIGRNVVINWEPLND